MHIIRGWFDEEKTPYITGFIEIPFLNIRKTRIDFLLDTGADCTILGAKDAFDLEIPLKDLEHHKFKNAVLKKMIGIGFGGKFTFYRLTCERIKISFNTANNDEIIIPINSIHILPMKYLKLLPESVIGRDILNIFEISCISRKNLLELSISL